MTAGTMRSFAAGLLAAATLVAIVYFLSPSEAKTTEAKEVQEEAIALTEDEMKAELTDKDYIILTEDEWSKQLAEAKASAEPAKTEEPAKEDEKETESAEKVVYRTMLTVTSGMTSIDVGDALERANVIKNANDFFKEVEKRGLSNELRPGTFEVESGMTMDELVSIIFK
ncbi:endolytic transglycosylase MltG [Cytobacillus gottheilii]|uniref:Endolytic transglycosylase MltG n=1 Tax=Cytobacillus gottheilii TaxID=859144 RepID=A0ABX8FEH7_9BACI|nr:endolytic transglycosylase MltG [Cytobacillus gottheilii]QVY62413.1 hypothetical protein J1899_04735 [Cytobacillus gottheilii]